MYSLFRLITLPTLLITAMGCGSDPNSGPFGPPNDSPLLSPFAGKWTFEFEKTLDALKATGTSDENIERLRKLYAANPQLGNMHPDITITGDVAVSAGVTSSEYRFFTMHQHDNKVCGKAWHHEDRFDPGDMSKCYVRLMIKEKYLYMEVKMKDGLPDLNDPDLLSTPPAEGGSVANCEADDPPGNDWSVWTTYVFSRKQ